MTMCNLLLRQFKQVKITMINFVTKLKKDLNVRTNIFMIFKALYYKLLTPTMDRNCKKIHIKTKETTEGINLPKF